MRLSVARFLYLFPVWKKDERFGKHENDRQKKQDVNILACIVSKKFDHPDDEKRSGNDVYA
jgi:hypothetical protein